MKCSNCGWPFSEDDLYCHRCGTDHSGPIAEGEPQDALTLDGLSLPGPVLSAFQMVGAEKAVGLWRCRAVDEGRKYANMQAGSVNGVRVMVPLMNDPAKVDGLLALTNRRLVFLREDRRIKGLSYTNEVTYSLAYALELGSVAALERDAQGVTIKVQKGPGDTNLVTLSKVSNVGRGEGSTLTSADVRANLQRLLDRFWKEEEARKNNIHLVMDFSFLKDVLGKGGLVLQSAKCPNCGGLIKLPEGGSLVKCDYCGGTLQAVDVLQGLRALLSDIRTG